MMTPDALSPPSAPHAGLPAWLERRAAVLTIALTLIVTVASLHQSLVRYHEFRSGFSWDLAYYNQWFWAVTHGDGLVTVRPGASYAFEGPSVWKMNYLSPIRLVILPLYAFFADPRTLLAVQSVVFWWVVPAAYALVRSESASRAMALSAAALVPLTPLAWPLAMNDFRELQLAIPFVLLAIQGWRQRRRTTAALGIAGMLACRQEFALVVMSLSLVPPRLPEPASERRTWTLAALGTGATWFVLFLVYLAWQVGPHAPSDYLIQFAGPPSALTDTGGRALAFLLVGLGSWAVMALFALPVALLAVPWMFVVSSGHWDLQLLATPFWHHVRYTAPMTALLLAAGLLGYTRVQRHCSRYRGAAVVGLWLVTAVGLVAQSVAVHHRFAAVPRPIAAEEAARLWSFIAMVEPEAGVFASYAVTAPLSSRRWLYSYELPENRPAGYPWLPAHVRWAFVRAGDLPPAMFTQQGFSELDAGPVIQVFRRGDP
jgi:hypothetical protein